MVDLVACTLGGDACVCATWGLFTRLCLRGNALAWLMGA